MTDNFAYKMTNYLILQEELRYDPDKDMSHVQNEFLLQNLPNTSKHDVYCESITQPYDNSSLPCQ